MDPSQYRGITLLSVMYKAFCRILGSRLVGIIESEKLLSDEQNGFRKGRGCIDHVLVLNLLSEIRMKTKKETYMCFIDLKKAYDSVDRDRLWGKLESMGIQEGFLDILKEIYRDVKCQVKVNEDISRQLSVGRGLRQGCVLSTTLFSLFIDDIGSSLKDNSRGVDLGNSKMSHLLYADDLVLMEANTVKNLG